MALPLILGLVLLSLAWLVRDRRVGLCLAILAGAFLGAGVSGAEAGQAVALAGAGCGETGPSPACR